MDFDFAQSNDFGLGIGNWGQGERFVANSPPAPPAPSSPHCPFSMPQLTSSLDDAQEKQGARAKNANGKHERSQKGYIQNIKN